MIGRITAVLTLMASLFGFAGSAAAAGPTTPAAVCDPVLYAVCTP